METTFSIPLDMVCPGVWADVVDVYGDTAWVCRMGELGICHGCRLRVVSSGQPCIVEIGATRLSVRGDAVGQILVCPAEIGQ